MVKAIGRREERTRNDVAIDAENPFENLTKQSFTEECDINNVIARYRISRELPPSRGVPRYLDVSALPSFHDALNLSKDVHAALAALPAEVRREVANDPKVFVEKVLTDPQWAIKHGLAREVPPPPGQPSLPPSAGGQPAPVAPAAPSGN